MESCIFCGSRSGEGLKLLSSFLCGECEKQLMNTDPADARYPLYVEKLKKIWPNFAVGTNS